MLRWLSGTRVKCLRIITKRKTFLSYWFAPPMLTSRICLETDVFWTSFFKILKSFFFSLHHLLTLDSLDANNAVNSNFAFGWKWISKKKKGNGAQVNSWNCRLFTMYNCGQYLCHIMWQLWRRRCIIFTGTKFYTNENVGLIDLLFQFFMSSLICEH